MENCLFRAKKCSLKYGIEILKLLYENPKLFHQEICDSLSLRPAGLNAIMSKMLEEELVIKENIGKNVYYYLPEKVNNSIARELNGKEELKKVLFLNMLKCSKSNPYVPYFLRNIEYTFSYFGDRELIMLLFVLEICNYESGQCFSSLFNLSDVESIEVKQNLLKKFQGFLFHVIGRGSDIPNEEEMRQENFKL